MAGLCITSSRYGIYRNNNFWFYECESSLKSHAWGRYFWAVGSVGCIRYERPVPAKMEEKTRSHAGLISKLVARISSGTAVKKQAKSKYKDPYSIKSAHLPWEAAYTISKRSRHFILAFKACAPYKIASFSVLCMNRSDDVLGLIMDIPLHGFGSFASFQTSNVIKITLLAALYSDGNVHGMGTGRL